MEGPFCVECGALLEVPPPWRCTLCAGPLQAPESEAELPLCPPCRGHPPSYAKIAAPFVYGGAVAVAIHRLKYRGRREVTAPLATLIVVSAADLLEAADLVVPIPLHPHRRRERGYDQATLLAREVARLAGRSFRPDLLRRTRENPRQVGLNRKERIENLQGAFAADQGAKERSVVVVDDVVTTGATAEAASHALLAAGARQVVVLAVARAM